MWKIIKKYVAVLIMFSIIWGINPFQYNGSAFYGAKAEKEKAKMAVRGMSLFTHEGVDYTINDPNIGVEFDASNVYQAGDLVNYQGDLYMITAAHASNTAWNDTIKSRCNIGDRIYKIKTNGENILPPVALNNQSQRYGSGITYTLNRKDGSVRATGTAIYDAWIHLFPVGSFDLEGGGLFFLSGAPAGSSDSTYRLFVDTPNDGDIGSDYGSGKYMHIADGQAVRVGFVIKAGQTVNLTFTPSLVHIKENTAIKEESAGLCIGSNAIQFWDNNTEVNDTYWYGNTRQSSAGYRTNLFYIQAGKMYYKRLSGAFTFVYDFVTGTTVSLQNGYGKSQYIHDGDITLENPSMIFATSNDDRQPFIVNNAEFPNGYVYGIYSTRSGGRIIVAKDGTGDYTTLKEALEYAIGLEGATVEIRAGEYNLIDEFGADYFANMSSSSSESSGLQIGNGMTLEFSPKSKVVCNYTGNNYYARTRFSPFNYVQSKGYTIIGLNLECSNVRYAIHDEAGTYSLPYKNKYIDCKLSKDNSGNTDWANPLVIGGGLGQNGRIEFLRCYFNAAAITGIASGKSVNYHNNAAAGAKSDLYMEGCYFDGIYTCGLSYYGSSTEITVMQINGCSLPAEPYINREGSASVENVTLKTFCNEIRN